MWSVPCGSRFRPLSAPRRLISSVIRRISAKQTHREHRKLASLVWRPTKLFIGVFMKSYSLRLGSLVLSCLSFSSCYTIRFHAEPRPLITTAKTEAAGEWITHSEKVHFFLWGLLPDPAEVNLSDIARRHAPNGISSVRIHEEGTTVDVLIAIITVGIYRTRTVVVEGNRILR